MVLASLAVRWVPMVQMPEVYICDRGSCRFGKWAGTASLLYSRTADLARVGSSSSADGRRLRVWHSDEGLTWPEMTMVLFGHVSLSDTPDGQSPLPRHGHEGLTWPKMATVFLATLAPATHQTAEARYLATATRG